MGRNGGTQPDPVTASANFWVDVRALPLTNTLGALSRDDLRRCLIPRTPSAEQCRYLEEQL
jgi:hypothetical protein